MQKATSSRLEGHRDYCIPDLEAQLQTVGHSVLKRESFTLMQARFRLAFTTTVLAIAPQADTWAATGSSNPALGISDLEDDAGPRELEAFLPPLDRDPFTRSLPSTKTLSSSTIRIIG